MKVVITGPSLDETQNVSGISSLLRAVIKYSTADFVHFRAARKDRERFGAAWLGRQFVLPIQFFRLLRQERPNIVHINTSFVPLAILRDAVLARIAGYGGVPVVLHIHGGEFVMSEFRSGAVASAAKTLLKKAAVVIALGEAERQNLLKLSPASNIVVLRNAIDMSEIPEIERGSGEFSMVYFGRLHRSKGLAQIVETCRRLRNDGFAFTFRCCGSGPDADPFIAQMTELLGDCFSYGGVLTGASKWDALGRSDLFLLLSDYEGLPLALLEAMAAGCVPVVSDVGSVAEAVTDGTSGFLIEPGNINQAVGILKSLFSDRSELARLRRNARITVAQKFDIKDHVRRLEKIYGDVAGESPQK